MRKVENEPIPIGLKHEEVMIVRRKHTVPHVDEEWPGFVEMPFVFATAMLVGFVEQTCIMAIRPYLETGQITVGTYIDMSHTSPTLIGSSVTARIELVSIVGSKLKFSQVCMDDNTEIGRGFHERAIINEKNFMARLEGINS